MYFVGDFIPQFYIPVCKDIPKDEYILANLEGPICEDNLEGISKTGIRLHSRPFPINHKYAFVLANNHFMDYKEVGYSETIDYLSKNNVPYAGAGKTIEESRKPMILEENGCRIAVISCCEKQFGVAEHDICGVSSIGDWAFEAVKDAKVVADYVVVSCHVASEFSPFVSPHIRKFYHRLIDAGVNVIHGHHSHVPQGVERYKGGIISYGLGNYMVDTNFWKAQNERWSRVIRVRFSKEGITFDDPLTFTCCTSENTICAYKVPDDEMQLYNEYCKIVDQQCSDNNLCASLWQEACVRLYYKIYEQSLRAPSTTDRQLSKRDILRKLFFILCDIKNILLRKESPTSKSLFYAKGLYTFFACQSHVDVISTALGVVTGTLKDRRNELSKEMADFCGL